MKLPKNIGKLIWVCLISIFFITPSFANQNLYKYKNSNGEYTIGNSLPPEAAKFGYYVISPRGNVIEEIPPEKTKAEILQEKQKLAAEKQAALKAHQEALLRKKQEEQDNILLKTFGSTDDIKRSRDQKIHAIEVVEQITVDNIASIKKQLQTLKKTAANYERRGQPIPKKLSATINDSIKQIEDNENFLEQKSQEKENLIQTHQKLIDRFNQLSE